MAKKPTHHPPVAGIYSRPINEQPGFILGGNAAVAGFGCCDFYIGQIPRAVAVETILAHHYSGRVVQNSYIHLGVFLAGKMLGVLQFGYALNPRCAGAIVAGTEVTQYLELNRMWLSDEAPRNSESRAISYCIKYIRRVCPQVAWIQSFADERCGGWGVVYQAANFEYLGHHKTTFYELDGETYHEMLLTTGKKGGTRGDYLRQNIERAKKCTLLQFRYIYFIRRSWRARLVKCVLPFPKPGQPLPNRRSVPWKRAKSFTAL